MHALVTGSSGFIGRALVAEVRRRGHGVRRAVRRRAQQDADLDVAEVGELSGSTDWSEAYVESTLSFTSLPACTKSANAARTSHRRTAAQMLRPLLRLLAQQSPQVPAASFSSAR